MCAALYNLSFLYYSFVFNVYKIDLIKVHTHARGSEMIVNRSTADADCISPTSILKLLLLLNIYLYII